MSANANRKHRNLLVTLTLTAFVVAACVSTDGAQLRNGSRSPSAKPAEDAQLSLSDCLQSCDALDCQRACVRQWSEQLASTRRAGEEQRTKADQYTHEAFINLRFCAGRYLDRQRPDNSGFETCIWGVSQLFLGRVGWKTEMAVLDPDARQTVLETLSMILRTAEAANRAGTGAVQTVDEAVQMEGFQAVAALDEGTQPKEASPTFQSCIEDLDSNKAFCRSRYPNGSTDEQFCLNGAETAFKLCLKKIYAL